MQLIKIDRTNLVAEIAFEKSELIAIYKAFAQCDIKVRGPDYMLFMNIEKLYMDHLLAVVEEISLELEIIESRSLIYMELIAFDLHNNIITIGLSEWVFSAIFFALFNVPELCDEEECSILTGIEWEVFQKIKRQIAFIIQRLYGSRIESFPFVQN